LNEAPPTVDGQMGDGGDFTVRVGSLHRVRSGVVQFGVTDRKTVASVGLHHSNDIGWLQEHVAEVPGN